MPRGDQTGPMGAGAVSGRGAGFCRGYNIPGYANPEMAGRWRMHRRYGQGIGNGGRATVNRGWRHRYVVSNQLGPMYATEYPAPDPFSNPVNEKESLRDQIRTLQSELSAVSTRLDKIDKQEE